MNNYVLISLLSFAVLIIASVFTVVNILGLKSGSLLYDAGYAKGIADAKASPNIHPPVKVDEIDCYEMPDAKPGADIGDWCIGYKQGFVDTIMNMTR